MVAFAVCICAQFRVKGTFSKWSRTPAARGLTGYEAARLLLDASGLRNVPIEPVRSSLTDHYDPVHRIVRLSAVNFASATAPFLFLAVLLFTSSTLIAVMPKY
ncbi:zinc metallopeptidase [Paenibacillus harenae]|uniref:zinc metallopeptidase n=1 Tax=Paenibacillus harenae TaxID=306543 RepID=UPI002790BD03|nr:Zn-dependent membrane protease YugP [Paenibacillus harenae]